MKPSSAQMAMAAAMLGMQSQGGEAAAFAIALVTHTAQPWQPPTGRALERARKTAARYKISDDLAIFVPRERRGIIGRMVRDEYRGVIIALKRLDELQGDDRAKAIEELKALLGAGGGAQS